MSLAEEIYLSELTWADLTAEQKRDAVYQQLAQGRTAVEAAAVLSVTYGVIAANHVRGVADRHDLNDDPDVQEARRQRRVGELRAAASRARARKGAELPKAEPLPVVPLPVVGNPRKTRNVTLMDLRDGQCRMPLWDETTTGTENKFYCGHPTETGSSFCAACGDRLYSAPVIPLRPYVRGGQ